MIVSVACGVTLASMESVLPNNRLVRVMPNTPSLVGAGASGIALNDVSAERGDDKIVCDIMKSVGITTVVPENLIHAVTGVSGSGPAYVFMFIEALADGAVKQGLPRNEALKFAAQTVFGSAKLVLESKKHPGVLRDAVASPGGSTIDAIHSLEENGLRHAVISACESAANKSRVMSKKL